jgi:hypothetical protein
MGTPLAGGTATVTSPSVTLQFPFGNTATFPSSNPGDVVRARVRIHRRIDSGGIQVDSLAVQYDDSGWLVPGARSASSVAYGNVDEFPSSNEGFEERTASLWTDVKADTRSILQSPSWSKVQPDPGSINHAYNMPVFGVLGSYSDHSLVSPPLIVGSGAFGFTFQTAYKFSTNTNAGGVVEISTDDGATWSDVGNSMSPGYNSSITLPGMPLNGRQVFGKTSASYPSRYTVSASLGTAYAGQTVRLRFRGEAATSTSNPGWTIDNVNFSGVTNTPFTAVVVENQSCNLVAVDDPPPPAALEFALEGANPGPGAPGFRFELPNASSVTISLYDVSGRRVATLANGPFSAGIHHLRWSRTDARAGVYFARMVADGRTINRRVVILAD